MARYLARRLLIAIPTLLALSFLIFLLVTNAPGDPAEEYARKRSGSQEATAQDIRNAQKELGLDRPFFVQYGSWIKGLATGDLGESFAKRRPVYDVLKERITATLELTTAALLLILVVGLPLGVMAAMFHRHWTDQAFRVAALMAASIPGFFLAYMLIVQLATEMKLLPVAGRQGWESLIMPAIVVAITPAAVISRLLRASLLEVFTEDYIRTARSKGLGSLQVVLRHGLRNASIPVVTYLGTVLGALLEGVVITEFIFAWPGLGLLTLEAISQRDYPLIQAAVLMAGAIYLVGNLLVDVLYGLLDPRIRLEPAAR
ncbi:MAG TPA: ABC transporter permease [Acidimicrobiales bacterium]|nr:ABC transporter permease [Acidimicrobiales bacterium]HWI02687.1 ABC transporter permease [Acidimicrobiales bacterium]